jgi:hypothetical protein
VTPGLGESELIMRKGANVLRVSRFARIVGESDGINLVFESYWKIQEAQSSLRSLFGVSLYFCFGFIVAALSLFVRHDGRNCWLRRASSWVSRSNCGKIDKIWC